MQLRRNTHGNRRAGPGNRFNGNFASLFPGAYQVIQSDLGLTYGGQTLASGTTPPVGSLTGALTTPPVPLWFKCTNAAPIGGAVFNAYADGLGVTPFMTGIVPTAGVPVALTGPCTGLSHAWAAGTAALDNVWKATSAAQADQSGNGKHASQAVPASQPVITAGLNGKVGLLFDGVNDYIQSTVGTLFTTSYLILVVGRITGAAVGSNAIVSGSPGNYAGTIYQDTAGTFSQYASGLGNSVAFFNTTNQRWAAKFTNSAADSLRIGSLATVTGVSAGGAASATRTIGASGDPGQYAKFEMFSVIYLPTATDYSAFDAALNSAGGYGSGAIAI